MTTYRDLALNARKANFKETRETLKKIDKIYEESIKELSEKLKKQGDGLLGARWTTDNIQALKRQRAKIAKQLKDVIVDATEKGAENGIGVNKKAMDDIFDKAGFKTKQSFTSMFSAVQQDVLADIIDGELYKDNRSLSSRIWNLAGKSTKNMQDVILEGITQKKSARNLAKDLEQFLKPPSKREEGSDKRNISYEAKRLARTAINHSYQTATIRSSSTNPFVEKIEWKSALQARTCQLCIDRDGQLYDMDDVPLDHPNGLCCMIPYVPKSFEEMGKELNRWVHGEENEKLDKWHEKYGEDAKGKWYNKGKKVFKQIGKETKSDAWLEEVYKRALKNGHENGTEILLWNNEDGSEAFKAITGNKNSVTFTPELIEFLNNAKPKTLICTHNHPSSSSFSGEDLNVMSVFKSIKELRVIGHDGTEYYVSIANGERPNPKDLINVHKQAIKKYQDKYQKRFDNGEDAKILWKEHTNEAMEDIAKQFNWEYWRKLK